MSENEENVSGMQSYSYFDDIQEGDRIVSPQKITYGDAVFSNFEFREVFINKESKGEYYIKIFNNTPQAIMKASFFLANKLSGCEVGLIDPTNELKLQYHIYIKTDNELLKASMLTTMNDIDNYINTLKSKKL